MFDKIRNFFCRNSTQSIKLENVAINKDSADDELIQSSLLPNIDSTSNAELVTKTSDKQCESVVPIEFNPDLYLLIHGDVRRAGVDPLQHYIQHGAAECRTLSLPVIEINDELMFCNERKTVLVVSHDASRTGAPILALNLINSLKIDYNVVALILNGGILENYFKKNSSSFLIAPNLRDNPELAKEIVEILCERFAFHFAIANSVESRIVLPFLASHFVPTVSLIHEFASYTRPKIGFHDAIFWSPVVVFSTRIVKENAIAENPEFRHLIFPVIPQGRCNLPDSFYVDDDRIGEQEKIRSLVRPVDAFSDIVVLGAGFVQIRKGIDLFIQIAGLVRSLSIDRKFRFIWIGNGYDPDNDMVYSVYLSDQIQRAGLVDDVFIIKESAEIDIAYEQADIFLLSSRLDPLPNVAIDAMAHAVPVLCFEHATGISDFLIKNGFKDDCVAQYLDCMELARKIVCLGSSDSLRESLGVRLRDASKLYFDMNAYVGRLCALATESSLMCAREKEDCKLIAESGLFDKCIDWAGSAHVSNLDDRILTYVRAWSIGVGFSPKTLPFDSEMYLRHKALLNSKSSPLADFLRCGSPNGPWLPVSVSE